MSTRMTVLFATALAIALAPGVPAVAQTAQKVRVATEGAYEPFNYKDPNGQLQGFDVEIAKAVCAKAKFDCEIVAQDWDAIIPALLAKKYNAIIAHIPITNDR